MFQAGITGSKWKLSESSECLLIVTAVSYKAGEDFSGREKNILLPLQKTVTEPNAECCILALLCLR